MLFDDGYCMLNLILNSRPGGPRFPVKSTGRAHSKLLEEQRRAVLLPPLARSSRRRNNGAHRSLAAHTSPLKNKLRVGMLPSFPHIKRGAGAIKTAQEANTSSFAPRGFREGGGGQAPLRNRTRSKINPNLCTLPRCADITTQRTRSSCDAP
jgi:hypothetical protein